MSRRTGAVWVAVLALLGGPARAGDVYDVLYSVRIVPSQRLAEVEIEVRQKEFLLRELGIRIDPERHADWSGDGRVERRDETVHWEVPEAGGRLRYAFRIDHLRDERSYDARAAGEWAIFRGDDLAPPVAARARKGARSRTRLRLRLPEGWSAATPYVANDSGTYEIENPGRHFDRPTGWILTGKRLGVVRETVAGVRVTLAAPAGQGVRRLDQLALLRWTLPDLQRVVGRLPERLLVVGAGDPLWRGGLSGPASLFLHASRPLITPDGTSPLLHEVLHVSLSSGGAAAEDWLVEGMAEYYALVLLERSRTVSTRRYDRVLAGLAKRGRDVRSVRGARAHGPVTARAVTLLAELDARIRKASGAARSLDDALRALVEDGSPLTLAALRAAAEAAAGTGLGDFFERPVFANRRSQP